LVGLPGAEEVRNADFITISQVIFHQFYTISIRLAKYFLIETSKKSSKHPKRTEIQTVNYISVLLVELSAVFSIIPFPIRNDNFNISNSQLLPDKHRHLI